MKEFKKPIFRVIPEDFKEILNGRHKVSGGNKDTFYKVGDTVTLVEYTERKKIRKCTQDVNECESRKEASGVVMFKFDPESETLTKPNELESDQAAIQICGKKRAICGAYERVKLTGRSCVVKITEILLQNDIFVSFKFDILSADLERQPFNLILKE